jgi:hypothetical protein
VAPYVCVDTRDNGDRGVAGGQDTSSTESSGPAGGQKVDMATAGTITGSAMLEGAAPANEPIRMSADPICVREVKGPRHQERFVVGSGETLANVFVYVKDGLGNYVYDPPIQQAARDEKGCRYMPHVFGVRVDQPIEIINSDPTLHNIHAPPRRPRNSTQASRFRA